MNKFRKQRARYELRKSERRLAHPIARRRDHLLKLSDLTQDHGLKLRDLVADNPIMRATKTV